MTIRDNIFEDSCLGAELTAASTVESNVFRNFYMAECENAGVFVNGVDGALINGNTMVDMGGSGLNGISIKGANVTVTNNTITGNENGIMLEDVVESVINNNILSCNGKDLYSLSYGVSGTVDARNNQWDHAPPEEWNYDFAGADIQWSTAAGMTMTFDTSGSSVAPNSCPTGSN